VIVFGCLGGALMIAMVSFYSSLAVLYYGCPTNPLLLSVRAAKTRAAIC
jgi:hypothetical protein